MKKKNKQQKKKQQNKLNHILELFKYFKLKFVFIGLTERDMLFMEAKIAQLV